MRESTFTSDYSVSSYAMPCMLPHTHSHTRAHMHPHAGCACWHNLTAVRSTRRPRNSPVHGGTVSVRTHVCSYSCTRIQVPIQLCTSTHPCAPAVRTRPTAARPPVGEARAPLPQDLLWIVALSVALSQGTVMRRSCRFLRCAKGIGRPICPNNVQSHAIFGSDASAKGNERCVR